MTKKIAIFISYADQDEELLKALESQLTPLVRNGTIDMWHRRKVIPGQELSREVDAHLKAAHLILLLISPNYLASDDLYNEMTRAMRRYETEKVRVIPVLLRPIYWEDTPFKDLEPLPTNRKPVSRWPDKSDALDDIERGIRKAIRELTTPAQTGGPSVAAAVEQSSPGEAIMPNQPTPKEATFDVFLCHNTVDKPAVKEIARQLVACGIKPWLDEWELRPGIPWQPPLEEQIRKIKSGAVFIGSQGIGPWQRQEVNAFIRRFVNNRIQQDPVPVIPIFLKTAPKGVEVPVFLEGFGWIDFRESSPGPIEQLVWGITGKNPHHENTGGSQQAQGQAPASPPPVAPPPHEKPQQPEDSPATSTGTTASEEIEVFLVHAPGDKKTSQWIEEHIAEPLEDVYRMRIWYDEWDLIPGTSEGPSRAENLMRAKSCAVCISDNTSLGWYQTEIERANHRRVQNATFRVIPILLPDVTRAKANELQSFTALKKYNLELNVPVDFRDKDEEEALYLLACGIRGVRPGRRRAGKAGPVPPPPAT